MAMRIYHGGRQTGKTEQVIKWLRKNPYGYVIVPDESQRQYILKRVMMRRSVGFMTGGAVSTYGSREEAEKHVITFRDALGHKLLGRDSFPAVIDNLEMCLRSVLPSTISEVAFATHDFASLSVPPPTNEKPEYP